MADSATTAEEHDRAHLADAPSVEFKGDDIVVSAEALERLGFDLPPNRPDGPVLVRIRRGTISWMRCP